MGFDLLDLRSFVAALDRPLGEGGEVLAIHASCCDCSKPGMLMRQYFNSWPRFILEINVCELLSVVVANNEARLLLLDGPGRREAAFSRRRQRKAPALIARIVFYIDICKGLLETDPATGSNCKSPRLPASTLPKW